MKNTKASLAVSASLLITGCAYLAPTIAPKLPEKVTGHPVPNWKGITLNGVVKITDKEMDYHKALFDLNYTFAKKEVNWIASVTDNVTQGVLGLLALSSPIAAMVAHKMGLKTAGPDHISKTEADEKIKAAANDDPENAHKHGLV